MKGLQIRRGDIFYADLTGAQGSEQDGFRPAIVIQNDRGNTHSPTTQIVPLTTQMSKKKLPTHVRISQARGLETDSLALAEQLRTIDKSRLGDHIGRISTDEQTAVNNALLISIGLTEGMI